MFYLWLIVGLCSGMLACYTISMLVLSAYYAITKKVDFMKTFLDLMNN